MADEVGRPKCGWQVTRTRIESVGNRKYVVTEDMSCNATNCPGGTARQAGCERRIRFSVQGVPVSQEAAMAVQITDQMVNHDTQIGRINCLEQQAQRN